MTLLRSLLSSLLLSAPACGRFYNVEVTYKPVVIKGIKVSGRGRKRASGLRERRRAR